jgi:hypothetical protein
VALDSMVRQTVNVKEVTSFIDQYFIDEEINHSLRDYYLYKLKRANKIYNDDLSK